MEGKASEMLGQEQSSTKLFFLVCLQISVRFSLLSALHKFPFTSCPEAMEGSEYKYYQIGHPSFDRCHHWMTNLGPSTLFKTGGNVFAVTLKIKLAVNLTHEI